MVPRTARTLAVGTLFLALSLGEAPLVASASSGSSSGPGSSGPASSGPASSGPASSSRASSGPSSGAAAHPLERSPSDPSSAPVPRLTWRTCADGVQCATAAVPLDWSDPRGRTIGIALAKVPARGRRIGTLFVNPGGPGVSGVDLVAAGFLTLPRAVRERFDVVGFDPRFVGSSTPAGTCLPDTEYIDFLLGSPSFPITAAQESDFIDTRAGYAARCATQSRLGFASTASVARDLDLLRRAVGDSALTYLGYSYGTYLGQVYAQLFPGRVRAMALDGVLDATAWATGTGEAWQQEPFSARVGSAAASSRALAELFRRCRLAGRRLCPIAGDGPPSRVYRAVADTLLATPVDLGDGSVLDYPSLVTATVSVLYSPSDWRPFTTELHELYRALGSPPLGAAGQRVAGTQPRIDLSGRSARAGRRFAASAARRAARLRRTRGVQALPNPPVQLPDWLEDKRSDHAS